MFEFPSKNGHESEQWFQNNTHKNILVLHTYIKQTVLIQIHITLNLFIETSCLELVSFAAGSTPSLQIEGTFRDYYVS